MRRWLLTRAGPVWLAGLLAAALALVALDAAPRAVARLDTAVFDALQQLRPRAWGGAPVVVVDIDEASLARVGQWPWPRDVMARITTRLVDLGAAAVVFDVVFSEPDRTSPARAVEALRARGARVSFEDGGPTGAAALDNDRIFADAIAQANVVTALILNAEGRARPPSPKSGISFGGADPLTLLDAQDRAVANLPLLDEAAQGTGVVSMERGQTVVRRAPLLFAADGQLHPALALEALRVAQGASSIRVRTSTASGELAGGARPAIVAVSVGALEVPTEAGGELRVYPSPAAAKPTLPIHRLLDASNTRIADLVAGRIALIGASAPGLMDLRATALENVVPGVTVHADIIDQIVTGTFLTRPDWAPGLEWLAALVLPVLVVLALPHATATAHALWAALLVAVAVAAAWLLFARASLLVSPILPVASVAAAYMAGSAARLLVTEREGRFVRSAFGLYLAPTLVEQLAREPEQLRLGGEERELTVLFCDIRGFTALSEGLDPVALTRLLNDFLTPMTRALMERGATIDKYMGDAIMAFWNAPVAQPDHPAAAARAMLDMRAALDELNERAAREGRPRIEIGVGLNTGPCCVGNLGSQQRFNYSAIGDAVNVASRIEGLTKQYGLFNLVAEATARHLGDLAHMEVDRVGVVGRAEPLVVHTVLGPDRAAWSETVRRHDAFLAAWRAGDLDAARTALERLRDGRPEGLAQLLALHERRLDAMAREGVPADWDGVFRATDK